MKAKTINFFERVSEYISLLDNDELRVIQEKITVLLVERQAKPVSKKELRRAREDATMNQDALGRYMMRKLQESQEALKGK